MKHQTIKIWYDTYRDIKRLAAEKPEAMAAFLDRLVRQEKSRMREKGMARLEIQAMSAKQLLEELEALRNEREDFDDLEIYVDVVTRQSYEEEQAWNGQGEFTETLIAEGSAFQIVVPTGFDMSGDEPIPTGDYILIRSVELDG